MTKGAFKWTIALSLSFLVHAAAANWFEEPSESVQLSGGSVAEVALLGDAFADSLASGAKAERLDPAKLDEIEPLENYSDRVQPVEPASAVASSSVVQIETQATPPGNLEYQTTSPITQTSAAHTSSQAELMRAETVIESKTTVHVAPEKTQAADPVEVAILAPVENSLPLTAIPVPSPRESARPSQNRKAKKVEKNKTVKAKKPKRQPTRKKQPSSKDKPAERRLTSGNDGKNKVTAKKGVSDGSRTAKSSSRAKKKKGRNRSGNAAVSNYPGKVQRKVNRAKVKPRSRRATGRVVVAFVVSKSGSVSSVRVSRGSGNSDVDAAAVRSVKRAAPFPRIPDEAGRSRWSFNVPMIFK